MEEVTRIFNRQFQRCKNELLEVNCPQLYIDSVSKYFTFLKQDVEGRIKDYGLDEDKN